MKRFKKPNHSLRMLRSNTKVEDYTKEYNLYVKREDLSCPPPGPPFSKARGVYAHLLNRPEELIGVLDTRHSQAGHAVARACQILGKKCINYYPEFKYEPGHREPQVRAKDLGAKLHGLPAGRSCILYHQAKSHCIGLGGYMMPNALKLTESVSETAKEVSNCLSYEFKTVIIPASSATIAAGVIQGFHKAVDYDIIFIVHLGYSRSKDEVRKYIGKYSDVNPNNIRVIDEKYSYKDEARPGPTPPWPCDKYYDLKAFRWVRRKLKTINEDNKLLETPILFWNIG